MKFHLLSRRWFLKKTSVGTLSLGGMMSQLLGSQGSTVSDVPTADREDFVAALADTLIPTAEGYPGYRRL
ncbi:MAG: twin-arginine translocation signal domain-containing protein, partial [Acidobacteria bacterium]|nr:twin-arginine translocation signal domain-containing protein [Acidobacteriota bacterium]